MAGIIKFEDIEAWKDARQLASDIYKITSGWKDFSLRDQMRRSSASIMANIAEGFARRSNKEFSHFLYISKASAAELQSHLYLSLDLEYISDQQFKNVYEQIDKIQRKLSNFLKTLRNKRINA